MLGKTLPSARTCPFCDTHPTGSFFCCSPRSLPSSWDSRSEETASSPACFDWPFPRQDLLFVTILQCPLTESSSDFSSVGKVPVAHCYPLPSMKPTELYFQRSSLPTSQVPSPFGTSECWFLFYSAGSQQFIFSGTWIAGLIHRVNVLSQH